MQKASQWAGQKLSQKGSLVQPAIPVLDIPVDEDIWDQPSPQHVNAVPKVAFYPLLSICFLHVYHHVRCLISMRKPAVLSLYTGQGFAPCTCLLLVYSGAHC